MAEHRKLIPEVGAVVIGRNEGARLQKCLESVVGVVGCIVYVDSGSTDNSVPLARSMHVEVLELDMQVPFTAARARNEGFQRLREFAPGITFIQFVDGDCEIVPDWIAKAVDFLCTHGDIAVACGRRRERYPERSVYNMLCDIDWDSAVGETKACGGDALMRIDAFEAVNGFRADLIAGEEPELCVRLRAAGWRIWRLDEEMTLHDAAMLRFSQWWKRSMRAGHAFAQGAHLHGAPPERHYVRESRSAWLWGIVIPLVSLLLASYFGLWPFAMLLIFPLQVVRLALRGKRSPYENWMYASSLVIAKFPEAIGQIKFLVHRFLGRQSRLIEYK
jgi:GT2 family glycosyltransferase